MILAGCFDIDGTLVDSVDLHAEAWQRSFAAFGKDVPFIEVRAQIGKGGDQLLPVFLSKDEVDELGEKITQHRARLFRDEYLPKVRPFPGVRQLFDRLRRDGKRLALASSASGDELAAYERIAGITDVVDGATSADDVKRSKPFPDVFQAAVRGLGVLPSEAVAVGDSPYDAEAAVRAGVVVIGVLCGGFPREKLMAAGCRQVYRDLVDLLANYDTSAFSATGGGVTTVTAGV